MLPGGRFADAKPSMRCNPADCAVGWHPLSSSRTVFQGATQVPPVVIVLEAPLPWPGVLLQGFLDLSLLHHPEAPFSASLLQLLQVGSPVVLEAPIA